MKWSKLQANKVTVIAHYGVRLKCAQFLFITTQRVLAYFSLARAVFGRIWRSRVGGSCHCGEAAQQIKSHQSTVASAHFKRAKNVSTPKRQHLCLKPIKTDMKVRRLASEQFTCAPIFLLDSLRTRVVKSINSCACFAFEERIFIYFTSLAGATLQSSRFFGHTIWRESVATLIRVLRRMNDETCCTQNGKRSPSRLCCASSFDTADTDKAQQEIVNLCSSTTHMKLIFHLVPLWASSSLHSVISFSCRGHYAQIMNQLTI